AAVVEEPSPTAEGATAQPAASAVSAGQYSEAPMLADLVAAGELPPVEERLPVNPVVLPAVEQIGQYGGALRRAFNGVSDRWGPTKVRNESLTWYNPDLT